MSMAIGSAMGTFNIVPGIPTDTVLRFTLGAKGIQQATVHIEDAPIRFDDDWYFGYDVVDQIQITLLTGKPSGSVSSSIQRLFFNRTRLVQHERPNPMDAGNVDRPSLHHFERLAGSRLGFLPMPWKRFAGREVRW